MIPLSSHDKKRGIEMLNLSSLSLFKPKWKTELEAMLCCGMKAEIQSIASISVDFLSNVYIREKIQSNDYI